MLVQTFSFTNLFFLLSFDMAFQRYIFVFILIIKLRNMIYRIIFRIKNCPVKYMPMKCNSLFLPTIGLLYFLYFAEHLLPKQARFCDDAGQRFPPGEGCWVISLVRDWIPFPQLRSQVDHIDHFDTSQWITKNIHIMLLINKRKHGTVQRYLRYTYI